MQSWEVIDYSDDEAAVYTHIKGNDYRTQSGQSLIDWSKLPCCRTLDKMKAVAALNFRPY
jgi:hypothetical protein